MIKFVCKQQLYKNIMENTDEIDPYQTNIIRLLTSTEQ